MKNYLTILITMLLLLGFVNFALAKEEKNDFNRPTFVLVQTNPDSKDKQEQESKNSTAKNTTEADVESTLNMFSDLYVDCLKLANFSRYYLSEKLLTPEEGDKMCADVMDKAQQFLIFSKFSMNQIEKMLGDIKQKALGIIEKEKKNLEENGNKTEPKEKDDTITI